MVEDRRRQACQSWMGRLVQQPGSAKPLRNKPVQTRGKHLGFDAPAQLAIAARIRSTRRRSSPGRSFEGHVVAHGLKPAISRG